MTLVSIHQPNFLPWSKLLAKIVASDVYVAYDSVQFNKREYHARQLLLTAQGAPAFLSVPVRHTGQREVLRDMRIVNELSWREAHLRFLETHYGRTPYFAEVFPLLSQVYAAEHELLAEHNIGLIEAVCGYLGARVRIVRASALPHAGSREQRLLDLVRAVAGDAHLSSTQTTHHIDWAPFHQVGIPVYLQEFTHPVHQQGAGAFVPNLSAVDLLCHLGRSSIEVLRAANVLRELDIRSTA
jgi:hypothetical protein